MGAIRMLFSRILGTFTGRRVDDDVRAEMEAHLEMEIAELVQRGMTRDEARRQALLKSGGLTQGREATHDQRGLPWLENLGADLRYAVRTLRRNPAFSVVVVLTLALGIGANTAIFSVVRGVLLKPLPHRDGDKLVYLRQSQDGPGGQNLNFSVPEVRDFRTGVTSLAGIAEYSPFGGIMQVDNEVARVTLGLVTGNYFEVMGLSPAAGRLTTPGDDGQGVAAVMVLTHEFWLRRFGGDSAIIGKQIRLNGTPVTIIGVVQPAPFFPTRMDALMNMVISPHHIGATMQEIRDHRMTEVVARLKPASSVGQVQTEVNSVVTRLQTEYPQAYNRANHPKVAVLPFKEAIGEQASLTLYLLMGAAAFVMIIAAANVANLTLMRGVRREMELVARASLGAGVARLRRLLLAENMVLGLSGAALGVLIAVAGVPMLVKLANRYSVRSNEIHLDATVLGFTLLLAFGVALLFSLVAPLPSEDTLGTMATGGRRASGGLRKQRLQRGLVVVQVAVSVVLLAGAGLLTRTMLRLADVPTGLGSEEILTMQVNLLATAGQRPDSNVLADARERFKQMRDEISALPGVVAVGSGLTPLRAAGQTDINIEGRPLGPGEPAKRSDFRGASLDYFKAASIPLLKGRAFERADEANADKVVVVNQAFADQVFPGEDPIGKRIAVTGLFVRVGGISDGWREIVGVVGTIQDGDPQLKPRAAFYAPLAPQGLTGGSLIIRTDRDAASQTAAATRIIRRIAPSALIERVLTVSQIKDEGVAPRRLNAILISSFGVLAMLIAAVGIAGVLAFSVSARTHEIGIRMSLGATSTRVERMILGEGSALVLAGVALGVGGAFVGTSAIQGLLFGVQPHDPVTFGLVALAMTAIGIVACWIPALRAARIDPAITMHSN